MKKLIIILLILCACTIATLYSKSLLSLTDAVAESNDSKNVKINPTPLPDWRDALKAVPPIKPKQAQKLVEITDPYYDLKAIQEIQQVKDKYSENKIDTKDVSNKYIKYNLFPIPNWRDALPLGIIKDKKLNLYGDKKLDENEAMSSLMKNDIKKPENSAEENRFHERPFAPKNYYSKKEILGRILEPSNDMYESWLDHQSRGKKSSQNYYVPKSESKLSKTESSTSEWSDLD